MTIFQRLNVAKQLWQLLIPSCPAPDDSQLARWLGRFTDTEMEYAIGRTAVKLRRGLLGDDAADAYRFCTGVLLNERKAIDDSTINPTERRHAASSR